MSLAELLNTAIATTATIARVIPTQGSAGGQQRSYTSASRGTLPTSTTGSLQPVRSERRFAYSEQDMEIDAEWFTKKNPQCDNRDLLTVGSNSYFVQSQEDPVNLGAFYKLRLRNYSRGVQ